MCAQTMPLSLRPGLWSAPLPTLDIPAERCPDQRSFGYEFGWPQSGRWQPLLASPLESAAAFRSKHVLVVGESNARRLHGTLYCAAAPAFGVPASCKRSATAELAVADACAAAACRSAARADRLLTNGAHASYHYTFGRERSGREQNDSLVTYLWMPRLEDINQWLAPAAQPSWEPSCSYGAPAPRHNYLDYVATERVTTVVVFLGTSWDFIVSDLPKWPCRGRQRVPAGLSQHELKHLAVSILRRLVGVSGVQTDPPQIIVHLTVPFSVDVLRARLYGRGSGGAGKPQEHYDNRTRDFNRHVAAEAARLGVGVIDPLAWGSTLPRTASGCHFCDVGRVVSAHLCIRHMLNRTGSHY